MGFSYRFAMWSLALLLGAGLGASPAGAIDPSDIHQIPNCAPNFCGYLYDLDGAEANFGPTVRTCGGTCTGDWAPSVRIETSDGAIDTLTVSLVSLNHPANPFDLDLDSPVATVVISGDATLATSGCYSVPPLVACTRILNDSRFRVKHPPATARYDLGGATVTAFIDDATNQIERYHVTFGGRHTP